MIPTSPQAWEDELKHLSQVSIPCCDSLSSVECEDLVYNLHIFCNASQQAYGAVAYLTVNVGDVIHTTPL